MTGKIFRRVIAALIAVVMFYASFAMSSAGGFAGLCFGGAAGAIGLVALFLLLGGKFYIRF